MLPSVKSCLLRSFSSGDAPFDRQDNITLLPGNEKDSLAAVLRRENPRSYVIQVIPNTSRIRTRKMMNAQFPPNPAPPPKPAMVEPPFVVGQ